MHRFQLPVLKKLITFILFIFCLAENAQTSVPPLYENAHVKIIYVNDASPKQVDKKIDLKQEEEAWLKKNFALPQPYSIARNAPVAFIQELLKAWHCPSNRSLALNFLSGAEIMFFHLSPLQKKPQAKKTITIHGAQQTPPAYLLECIKACIPQEPHKISSPKAILAGALTISAAYTLWNAAQEATLKEELDAHISQQHRTLYPDPLHQSDAECILFFVHGCVTDSSATVPRRECLPTLFRQMPGIWVEPRLPQAKKYGSLAQSFDVYQAKKHLENTIEWRDRRYPSKPIICIGHSNGASTLIATLSQHRSLARRLGGIILIASFADITEVGEALRKMPNIPAKKFIARRCIKYAIAPNHNCFGKTPCDWVSAQRFPTETPTLLIHAKDDDNIPFKNFQILQEGFRQYTNISFCALTTGGHYINTTEAQLQESVQDLLGKSCKQH